jgi:tRNA (guanine37-N1)-methyltransferase
MRIDIVSIFPEYLSPLDLSLVGKAREAGVVDIRVHDLREFATDRHRTVDDTPYGGGPGMVMLPEVWGAALDAVRSTADCDPWLVIPTPSGYRFDQPTATTLATREHLVFACGRYEGIDARVAEHYGARDDWAGVLEYSIGDYVLGGGEAAVLVMVEAAVRLIPGVLGNAESAADDSFSKSGGAPLEGPVFTKPPSWRDLEVPEVLLSGDHGRIAAWREEQAVERTHERRPDLTP